MVPVRLPAVLLWIIDQMVVGEGSKTYLRTPDRSPLPDLLGVTNECSSRYHRQSNERGEVDV